MDWKIELIAIPVSDVDRAKDFYTEKAGFNADHDHKRFRSFPGENSSSSAIPTETAEPCRSCPRAPDTSLLSERSLRPG
jgi:catechol 2,3-dioxygenase-like lactoylglutathione lyase family enzyme